MNGQYRQGDVVLSNWKITKKIGEGSFGKVYEIERQDFGETYRAALKVITVPQSQAEIQSAMEEGMSEKEAGAYFYSMVEEIVREFALMARVKGTAHVVGYEDHMVIPHTDGIGWDILIRMEKLTPLLTYAYSHPFSRREIMKLGIHLCLALEVCQKYNIIHRDIKPENIFVSENGEFKLGDFGIARTAEKTVSALSKKGTYHYMAPEVYRGTEYGFNVDIYSLGIVLYRMLNKNRLPFLPPAPEVITYSNREKALVQRMSGQPLPTPFYGEGRLGEIVLRAAAYEPKDRYSTPMQMRQELEAILYQESEGPFIYPDGDELHLKENVYASAESRDSREERDGREHATEHAAEESTISVFGGGAERVETESGGSAGKDGEDSTVSVFSGQSGSAKPPVPAKKKGPMLAVAAAAGIVGVALIVFLAGSGSPKKTQAPPVTQAQPTEAAKTAEEQYRELYEQAEALLDAEPDRAVELMEEARKLLSEEPWAEADYSYMLYRARKYDACISYIEQDLEMGKDYEREIQDRLMQILGASYYEKEDYAAAASFFRLSSAGKEMDEDSLRDYAVCLGRLGSLDEAREALETLRMRGADSYATQYVEAEIYYGSQEYKKAEEGFTRVMDFSTEEDLSRRAFRSLLNLYRDCAKLERDGMQTPFEGQAALKEIEVLKKGVERFGLRYDNTLYEMLGLACYEAYRADPQIGEGYLRDAIDAFEQALKLGVTRDYLFVNLYSIHYELGDYDGAEQVLGRMEEAYPASYVPHALRAILLIRREEGKAQASRDYSSAKKEYEKAAELLQSGDDDTYFRQLESLMETLESQGWL